MDNDLGKAIPDGVDDVTHHEGWVRVGVDHETAEFAGASIKRWWYHMGCVVYPKAEALLLIADGGGSNGGRTRLWKRELQQLANDAGLKVTVCHFPPGTSKWNKNEHRRFA
jgi:Rhodopirellula transposase DDE domain